MSTEQKFSLLRYVQQQELAPERQHSQNAAVHQERFSKLVVQVRSMLMQRTTMRDTESEQLSYSEMLNRAVLGFQQERKDILIIVQDWIVKQRIHDIPPPSFHTLAEAIFAEVIGLNVLELVLKQKKNLEEVQVIGTNIFEVRHGRATVSRFHFQQIKDVERIQQNLVLFNNDVLSPKKRWAEVMLSDGSRVTMTGFGYTGEPTLTIRFFPLHVFSLSGLRRKPGETLDIVTETLLKCILRAQINLVIIGATNSGKTHLMKAFIAELPNEERIITIESRLELKLKRDFPDKNIIEYEVDDDDPLHSSSQAFKLALRQSPRRIINAEIRDVDANIYVRACTRGHEGSMTTLHANHLDDVPQAITDMCMLDQRGMDSSRLIRRITQYVTQIGIEMEVVDGKRKIVRIGEIGYIDGHVKVRDIVIYDVLKKQWKLKDALSSNMKSRILKYDPAGYQDLVNKGWLR